MQFTINSLRQLFPDKIFSLIFSKIPDISLTAVTFPDLSRFSRQVVTLNILSFNNTRCNPCFQIVDAGTITNTGSSEDSLMVGCVAQLVERRSLTGELSLSYARPAADG